VAFRLNFFFLSPTCVRPGFSVENLWVTAESKNIISTDFTQFCAFFLAPPTGHPITADPPFTFLPFLVFVYFFSFFHPLARRSRFSSPPRHILSFPPPPFLFFFFESLPLVFGHHPCSRLVEEVKYTPEDESVAWCASCFFTVSFFPGLLLRSLPLRKKTTVLIHSSSSPLTHPAFCVTQKRALAPVLVAAVRFVGSVERLTPLSSTINRNVTLEDPLSHSLPKTAKTIAGPLDILLSSLKQNEEVHFYSFTPGPHHLFFFPTSFPLVNFSPSK